MEFNELPNNTTGESKLTGLKLLLSGILVVLLLVLYKVTTQKAETVKVAEGPSPIVSLSTGDGNGKRTAVPERGAAGEKITPSVTPRNKDVTVTNTPVPNAPVGDVVSMPVGFTVGGKVAELLVPERAQVRQGQLLAKLDTQNYEQAVTGARMRLEIAQGQDKALGRAPNPNVKAIEKAKAYVEEAQRTYDLAHAEKLKRQAQQVAAEKDNVYDNMVQDERDAALDLERMKRQLAEQEKIGAKMTETDGYKAAVTVARNSLIEAEADLNATRLLAPETGVVASRNVEVGSVISPGTSIYTLEVPVKK